MNTSLIKVYLIRQPKPAYSHIFFLYPNLGYLHKETLLFVNEATRQVKQIFEIVDTPADADFLLSPYNYFHFREDTSYVQEIVELSKKHAKKVLIFDISDLDYAIDIPNAYVLRTSQYRYKKRPHEHLIPPAVEDLGSAGDVMFRKKEKTPTVAFMGWAALPGLRGKIAYHLKTFLYRSASLVVPHTMVHAQGLYFRRRALSSLVRSSRVKTNFVIRNSYSGHVNTIELDPNKARAAYIRNITDSDFVLAPKGDGNYSVRFYETLSLGRIPVLIDTESELPAEDSVDYSSFILRVPYQDIDHVADFVADAYVNRTDEQFIAMQQRARDAFVQHLRPDVFVQALLQRLRQADQK